MTALVVSLISTAVGIVLQVVDDLLSASIDPTTIYLVLQALGLIIYLSDKSFLHGELEEDDHYRPVDIYDRACCGSNPVLSGRSFSPADLTTAQVTSLSYLYISLIK